MLLDFLFKNRKLFLASLFLGFAIQMNWGLMMGQQDVRYRILAFVLILILFSIFIKAILKNWFKDRIENFEGKFDGLFLIFSGLACTVLPDINWVLFALYLIFVYIYLPRGLEVKFLSRLAKEFGTLLGLTRRSNLKFKLETTKNTLYIQVYSCSTEDISFSDRSQFLLEILEQLPRGAFSSIKTVTPDKSVDEHLLSTLESTVRNYYSFREATSAI